MAGNFKLANKLLDEAGWTGRDAAGYRTNTAGKRLVARVIATNPTAPLDTILAAYQAEIRQEHRRRDRLAVPRRGNCRPRCGTPMNTRYSRASSAAPIRAWILDKVYTKNGTVNGPRLDSPEVAAWLEQGRYALNDEIRKAAYDKVAQYVLIDQAITLPLYTDRNNVAASAKIHDVTAFIDPPRGLLNGWAYNTWIEK